MIEGLCRTCTTFLRSSHFSLLHEGTTVLFSQPLLSIQTSATLRSHVQHSRWTTATHRRSSSTWDRDVTEATAAATADAGSQHQQEPVAAAAQQFQEADAVRHASADANGANDAPAAVVLVRDSTSLRPRLLQPPLAYDHTASKTRRSRRPPVAVQQASNEAAQHMLPAEEELQYFTTDVSAAPGLEGGFAAARVLQQQGADAAGLHSPGCGPAADKATGAAERQSLGSRSAAELEMQQVEELRQRRGGILAPEELEVVQVAKQRAAKKLLPMEVLASAIMNALEVGSKYGVDPKVLLTPRIAEMRMDLLQARAAQIKRMLPDAQLQEELLARGAEEVSGQITRIISVFRKQLGIGAPAQMLSQPGTFAKALRLPTEQLKSHLDALQHVVGSKLRARDLAMSCTNTVFSPSFPDLMRRVDRVATALRLTQAEAAEMVLKHPFLASTSNQLQHMEQMIQVAPAALRLPEQLVLACFLRHPDLFRYRNSNELAHKYQVLAGVLQGSHGSSQLDQQLVPRATPADLLAICCSSRVRQAVSMTAVAESLRTAAAIMGYTSPAQLLPMLLQPPKGNSRAGRTNGTGRRPMLSTLLLPSRTLAERASFVQQSRGLSLAEMAQQARWFPHDTFARDPKTRKLKDALLQGQLLGTEIVADDQLDPRMVSVLKQNPMAGNLQVDTVLQRIQVIQSALHLHHEEAKRLVVRAPHLLSYNQAVLQGLIQELVKLLGGNLETARDLVLQDPKVLLLISRFQAGTLQPKLAVLQSLLNNPQPAVEPASLVDTDAAAAGAAEAAVKAASRRAAASRSGSHGLTGVRQRPSGMWECRSYLVDDSKSHQYTSQHSTAIEAACAQDLIRLAVKGRGSAINFGEHLYTAGEVEAVATHLHHKRREWRRRQEQQQLQHSYAQQNQVAEVVAGALGPNAAGLVAHAAEQQTHPACETGTEGGCVASGPPDLASKMPATAAERHPADPAGIADPANGEAAADAAAQAAVEAAARAASSISSTLSHGMRGVKVKPMVMNGHSSPRWQMRVKKLTWTVREFYATYDTALEAACAYDLVQLVLRGPGSAVNLPQSVYTAEQVRAMAVHVYYKQHHHMQRLQHHSQLLSEEKVQKTTGVTRWSPPTSADLTAGTDGVQIALDQAANASAGDPAAAVLFTASARQETEGVTLVNSNSGTANCNQPPAAHAAAGRLEQQHSLLGYHQQGQLKVDRLFLSCLSTEAGRYLLHFAAETGRARLQALASILGISVSKLLGKALSSPGYLGRVLALSPERMTAATSSLQQQLDLSKLQLQQVLRKAPWLLLYKPDVLQAKLGALADAFASCCYAVQQVETRHGSQTRSRHHSTSTRSRGQPGLGPPEQCQSPTTVLDAVSCLQQAVLYAPQVLGLTVDRVAHRMQVLQNFCCDSHLAAAVQQHDQHRGVDSLVHQLQNALRSGSIADWLNRGDATYKMLEEAQVTAKCSGGTPDNSADDNRCRVGCNEHKQHKPRPDRRCSRTIQLRYIMKQGSIRAAEVLQELGLR